MIFRNFWPFLAVCACAIPADAQTRPGVTARARGEVYVDTDATTVWRPRVSASGVTEDLRVGATWTADVVSSASIDVVSRASQAISDTRHEATGTFAIRGPGDAEWGATGLYGVEKDYETFAGTLRAGGSLDPDRIYFLSGALSASANRVGTVADRNFHEHLETMRLSTALAIVASPETVLRAGLELGADFGFQSSAYRNVRLGDWISQRGGGRDPASGRIYFVNVTGVARESHPRRRERARASFDVTQALGDITALRGRFGLYADTWSLLALDAEAEVRVEPWPLGLVRIGGRYYEQTGAFFWRARYPDAIAEGAFVSDDKELGPMRSVSALVELSARFFDDFVFEARVEGTRYEYFAFTLLPEKWAAIAQIALAWEPWL